MKSFKAGFPKTPTAPPAPPKTTNAVATPTFSKPGATAATPTASPAVSRPTTPTGTTPQGDAFKTSGQPQASSSRPNIDAHSLQGPQIQSPNLSESDIADLALGRTPGKGRAVAPRPEIQKLVEDLKLENPGAEVLRYTDQGGHPMLKQPNLPAGTDAGVCSAMTSEWIRTGKEAGGDPMKGSQAFGKLTDHHFGKLIDKQHAEHLQGDALTKLNGAHMDDISKLQGRVELLQGKSAQRKEINELLTNPDLTLEQRQGLKAQRSQLTQELKDGMAQLNQDKDAIAQKQTAIASLVDDFRTGRGGGHPGVKVQDFEPITSDTFAQKLYAGTKENGHYRIGLRKSGESAEGHVLGLHKTDGPNRLLDANTAEWKTNSHEDAVNLTADHLSELYKDYSTFDITRY
ncbi:cell division protein ZapB [Corallococcus interemptor]|uniref:cell division protein ZapB n=1 Tax=Corallococcus interemptor TaxID=2316720 RepID=UPI0035D521FC